jgi:hypothetical protein
MVRTEKHSIVTETKIYGCDVCKTEYTTYPRNLGKCYICGRDVCQHCSHWFEPGCNLLNPSFDGDHPEWICNECWDKGKFYRLIIQQIRDKAEAAEEAEWVKWKEERKKEING